MTDSITIYSFADVDRSGKVRWTARELGYEIEERRVSLDDRFGGDYLSVNPYGQVPAAVVDGETWIESSAICILLAERHPESGLIPAEAGDRAGFWQAVNVLTSTLELPAVSYYLSKLRIVDAGWQALVGEAVGRRLQTFAGRLPAEGYLCGTFSLADIFAAYVLRIGVQAGLLDYEGKPAAYLDLLRSRPAAVESRIFDSLEN